MRFQENSGTLAWLLLPAVIGGGFFLTGWIATRGIRSPLPWATAFAASFVLLVLAVMGLDAMGIRISAPSLAGSLAILAAIGWALSARLSAPAPGESPPPAAPVPARAILRGWRDQLWLLPCLLALAGMLTRTWLDPLAGWDNWIRWDYLARLIAEQGSLAHYPPAGAADYDVYFWSDGIPPGVSLLNLCVYLGCGSVDEALILGRVALELGLTLALVHRLADRLWGNDAGKIAWLLLATSAIFAWSATMAQETGVTGVFLPLLAYLLWDYHDAPSPHTAAWVGLVAGALALTRDYNLLYVPVAAGLLLVARAPRRHMLLALGAATLAAAPWYLRNAWLTGNPLYPHAFGGLLPTNPGHADTMRLVRADLARDASAGRFDLHALLPPLGAGLGLLALAAVPGAIRKNYRTLSLAVLAAGGITLWALAAPQTGGGWNYGLRVLGPVAPLLAIFTGWWAARLPRPLLRLLPLLLLPLVLDAARRAWTFDTHPVIPAWPYEWETAAAARSAIHELQNPAALAALVSAARGEAILVDHPNYAVGIRGRDGRAMIHFSPEADPLYREKPDVPLDESIRTLRASGVRFVMLTQSGYTRLGARHNPSLRRLWRLPPTLNAGNVRIYDLALLNSEHPAVRLMTP